MRGEPLVVVALVASVSVNVWMIARRAGTPPSPPGSPIEVVAPAPEVVAPAPEVVRATPPAPEHVADDCGDRLKVAEARLRSHRGLPALPELFARAAPNEAARSTFARFLPGAFGSLAASFPPPELTCRGEVCRVQVRSPPDSDIDFQHALTHYEPIAYRLAHAPVPGKVEAVIDPGSKQRLVQRTYYLRLAREGGELPTGVSVPEDPVSPLDLPAGDSTEEVPTDAGVVP